MSTQPQHIMPLKQPWHNLRELQGLQGAISEWDGFPPSLLQITNAISPAIRCSRSGGCYMNVVMHSDGYVGICTSEPGRCDRRSLRKDELIIYRLNTTELLKALVSAIPHCQAQTETVQGAAHLWRVGHIVPLEDVRFPVFLSLGGKPSDLDKVVSQLSFKQEPYLLVGIIGSLFSQAALDSAIKTKSKLVGLDDLLLVNESGAVSTKPSATTLMNNWLEPLTPKRTAEGSLCYFPQSPGITWQSISVRFLDGQNVHVTCSVNQAAASAYEFSQFNMTDRRKKADDGGAMPNKAWAMLIKFSEDHGKILLKRDDAQTKKNLKERLQDFFGHQNPSLKAEDPFEEVTENGKKHYKAKFNVFARSDNNA